MSIVRSSPSLYSRKQSSFVSTAIDDQECRAEDRRLEERIFEALNAPEGRLRLYINNMRCGRSLTDDVCRIKSLRELYCHDNVRLERLPASLHHLGATLQVIDASRCNLTEVPEELAQLRFLKHLSLAGNKLKTFVWDCTPFIQYPADPYPITTIPSSNAHVADTTARLAPKWRTRQTDPPPLPSQGNHGKVRFNSPDGGNSALMNATQISGVDDDISDDGEFKFWGLGDDGDPTSPIPHGLATHDSFNAHRAPQAGGGGLRDRHKVLAMNYATGRLEVSKTAPTRSRLHSVARLIERNSYFAGDGGAMLQQSGNSDHLQRHEADGDEKDSASKEGEDNSSTNYVPTDGWCPAPGKPFTSLEFLDLSGNELVYLSPSALQLVDVLLDRSAWRTLNACAGSATVQPAVLLLPNPHLLQPAARVLTGSSITTTALSSSPPATNHHMGHSSPIPHPLSASSLLSNHRGPPQPHSSDPYTSLLPPFVSRCCMCRKDLHFQGMTTYVHFSPMKFPAASVSIARQERECDTLGGVPPQFLNGADVLPTSLHATHGASGHISTERHVLFGRRAQQTTTADSSSPPPGSYAQEFYGGGQSMSQRSFQMNDATTVAPSSCMVRVPTFFPLCSMTDCHIGLYARIQTTGTTSADMPNATSI